MSHKEAVSVRQVGDRWWVLLGGSLLLTASSAESAREAAACMTLMLRAGLDTALGIDGVRMATLDDVRNR